MITFATYRDSLFDCGADTLVVPCNLVPGVMGKGLAAEFRHRWPELPGVHAKLIREKRLGLAEPAGAPFLYRGFGSNVPVQFVFLATKDHFRDPSRLEWITAGLQMMRQACDGLQDEPRVVAVPALGCGLGGLKWAPVRDEIQQAHDRHWAFEFPGTDWIIFPPR